MRQSLDNCVHVWSMATQSACTVYAYTDRSRGDCGRRTSTRHTLGSGWTFMERHEVPQPTRKTSATRICRRVCTALPSDPQSNSLLYIAKRIDTFPQAHGSTSELKTRCNRPLVVQIQRTYLLWGSCAADPVSICAFITLYRCTNDPRRRSHGS